MDLWLYNVYGSLYVGSKEKWREFELDWTIKKYNSQEDYAWFCVAVYHNALYINY